MKKKPYEVGDLVIWNDKGDHIGLILKRYISPMPGRVHVYVVLWQKTGNKHTHSEIFLTKVDALAERGEK